MLQEHCVYSYIKQRECLFDTKCNSKNIFFVLAKYQDSSVEVHRLSIGNTQDWRLEEKTSEPFIDLQVSMSIDNSQPAADERRRTTTSDDERRFAMTWRGSSCACLLLPHSDRARLTSRQRHHNY